MSEKILSLPEGYSLIVHEKVTSTNEVLKDLIAANIPNKTIVMADVQTEGRGRYGRNWVSEPGNLYFSLYLKPEFESSVAPQLSFVSALAARDALKMNVTINFKWPNDLILNNKKVGGILLESYIAGKKQPSNLIIGVGINIKNYPENVEFPATSLHDEGIKIGEKKHLLYGFINNFEYWFGVWSNIGFSEIREQWLNSALNIGKVIRVRTAKENFNGLFQDIAMDGSLVLKTGNSLNYVSAGDVFFSDIKSKRKDRGEEEE